MTLETIFADADRGFEEMARAHRLAVAFEEELASERSTAAWYERNPEFVERWADLYGEHTIRLALLEKIERAGK